MAARADRSTAVFRKVLHGQLRVHLRAVFRGLAQHKESWIEEGHLMVDHAHMLLSIPPKDAVSNVMRFCSSLRGVPTRTKLAASGWLASLSSGVIASRARYTSVFWALLWRSHQQQKHLVVEVKTSVYQY